MPADPTLFVAHGPWWSEWHHLLAAGPILYGIAVGIHHWWHTKFRK